MTTSKQSVPLCAGLNKPGNAEKAEKALEARNHADYQCYMLLRELLDNAGGAGLEKAFYDPDLGKEWKAKARKWVEKRQDSNESFLNAVAGR